MSPRMWSQTVVPAGPVQGGPLAPADAQFATTATGLVTMPGGASGQQAPSTSGARPFGLRFLRTLGAPPAEETDTIRYDHVRQLGVSSATGRAAYQGRWHHTSTGPSQDGNNTPAEEFNMDK